MRAYAVKNKRGFMNRRPASYNKLFEAYFYRTKQQAFEECFGDDKVIPVEIKIIKTNKRKKK